MPKQKQGGGIAGWRTQEMNAIATVEVLPPAATAPEGFNDWLEVGRSLYNERKAIEWRCADWLNEGTERYPEQMALVLPMLATDIIEQKKLVHSAKVAATIPAAQRCSALTFAHHAHVAGLPLDERMALLSRAQSEGLSARALRIVSIERKAALGVGNAEYVEDDFEYHELVAIIRAWNRARPDARESFFDMATEAGLGSIQG